jgi:hypothetical protein
VARNDIEVSGVPEVLAALAALDVAADRQLDEVIDDAAETVASRTRIRMPMGPQPGGHLRSSVRIDRGDLRARVEHGGPRWPYAGWLEFGGRVGRRHAVKREWVPRGRYLYPALSTVRPGLGPAMHEGLRAACRESGWNPRG